MERIATCACGKVSIVAEGDPVRIFICHCDHCQKRTGSVMAEACWYKHSQIKKIDGETQTYSSPRNPAVKYEFCRTCGSTVHWTNESFPAIRGIAVGCFADKKFPKPDMELQTQYRHAWVSPIDSVPSFDEFPTREVLKQGL